jgi:tetratricopeptide (TPR) repeat protein
MINWRVAARFAALCCAAAAVLLSPLAASAAETLFERARNLYDVHAYETALALFERVAAAEPENGAAWDYASWCNRYLANWDAARQGFEKAGSLLPGKDGKWVKVGLGETYFGAGQYADAVGAFGEAIALDGDDAELVARALKGVALASASIPDEAAMNEAIASLRKTSPEAADEAAAEAAALLEKNRGAAPPASADLGGGDTDPGMTDARDRQFNIVEEEIPAPQTGDAGGAEPSAETSPDVDAGSAPGVTEPPAETSSDVDAGSTPGGGTGASLLDVVTLGGLMEDALKRLGEAGVEVRKIEEPTRLGSQFYVLSPKEGIEFPSAVSGADASSCALEEFGGLLLSVTSSGVWENRKGNISLKDSMFKEASARISDELSAAAKVRDTGLNTEAQWVSGGKRVITLSGTAGLDGTIVMKTEYADVPALKKFMEETKKAGEN